MKIKPVVLFTTPVLHHPPVGGPTLRIENSIKALSQISDLYIYSRVSQYSLGGKSALSFYRQYCESFYFDPFVASSNKYVNFAKRAANFLARRTIKRNVFSLDGESYTRDFWDLLKVADAIHADVIWLGYGNISYPLLNYIKQHSNYKVVVDTDSVWSRFVLRGLPYAESAEERKKIAEDGAKKEKEERNGAKLADVTTAVSEVDAEYYRDLSEDPRRVHIFSNTIDMDVYKQVPLPPENFKRPSICLAGSFGTRSPMDDAARWVINEVLPMVRERIPDIHLYLIGNGSDRVLSDMNDPHITRTGQLPSVLPYLCHTDVALVPLRFESGTRFKILEAGACGIPVVSTTLGAEGLPITHGVDILLADDPVKFASNIIRLIEDRDFSITMARNLKKLVWERNSILALNQEGKNILDYLLCKTK